MTDMENTTVNLIGPCPPTDDAAIDTAFTKLDAKLAAWSIAVTDVESAAAAMLDRLAEDADPPGVPANRSEPATEAEPNDPPPVPPRATDTHQTVGGAEQADACDPSAASGPTSIPAPAEEEPASPPARPTHDEEEALLNTLDPETADAIRVMRRLSPEPRSVRELITEYNQPHIDRPGPQSKSKKKTWWSRGLT